MGSVPSSLNSPRGLLGPEKYGYVRPDCQTPYPLLFMDSWKTYPSSSQNGATCFKLLTPSCSRLSVLRTLGPMGSSEHHFKDPSCSVIPIFVHPSCSLNAEKDIPVSLTYPLVPTHEWPPGPILLGANTHKISSKMNYLSWIEHSPDVWTIQLGIGPVPNSGPPDF